MARMIGIDLGTTNSCVAILENGVLRIIENSEGARTTPSIIAFTDDNRVLVGQSAKCQAATNPKNTFFAINRLIGRRFEDDVIQKSLKMLPYKIIKANNGDAWVECHGKKMAAPEVLARILMKLKRDAEAFLGESSLWDEEGVITEAVITVPAYFNDSQRQAIKDAGRIAGLDVKRIISSSTSAALAFGMDKPKGDRTIAVYDLGGGTLDISIIEITEIEGDHQFEVLATNGDTFLGGEDFDLRIVEFLVDEFKKDSRIDLHNNPSALQRLREAAEKAKVELSSAQQTEINLPYIATDANGSQHLNVKLTRSKLESLVDDLIEKTKAPCLMALKDAGLSASQINDVILVGGQTRMPKVQKMVQAIFGREPRKDLNPDEAVALGAAIQAGTLSGHVKDVLLQDVTSLSLGIETMGGVMTKLIEKHTTIPTNASQVFSTDEDNQTTFKIHVLQGEREVAVGNKSLGRFDLVGIPPAPRGTPQIEVAFDIDANGILNVSAKDKATGKRQSVVIKASSGLSDSEVERMVIDAEVEAQAEKELTELIQARNHAQKMISTAEKTLTDLEYEVNFVEKNTIDKAIEELQAVIKGNNREEIEEKTNALIELSNKLAERVYYASQTEITSFVTFPSQFFTPISELSKHQNLIEFLNFLLWKKDSYCKNNNHNLKKSTQLYGTLSLQLEKLENTDLINIYQFLLSGLNCDLQELEENLLKFKNECDNYLKSIDEAIENLDSLAQFSEKIGFMDFNTVGEAITRIFNKKISKANQTIKNTYRIEKIENELDTIYSMYCKFLEEGRLKLQVTCKNEYVEESFDIVLNEWQSEIAALEKQYFSIIESYFSENIDEQITIRALNLFFNYRLAVDEFFLTERIYLIQKYHDNPKTEFLQRIDKENKLFKSRCDIINGLKNLIVHESQHLAKKSLNTLSENLFNCQIDTLVSFSQDANLTQQLQSEFMELQQRNFETHLADVEQYGRELAQRNNDITSLMFKMQKDLERQTKSE